MKFFTFMFFLIYIFCYLVLMSNIPYPSYLNPTLEQNPTLQEIMVVCNFQAFLCSNLGSKTHFEKQDSVLQITRIRYLKKILSCLVVSKCTANIYSGIWKKIYTFTVSYRFFHNNCKQSHYITTKKHLQCVWNNIEIV